MFTNDTVSIPVGSGNAQPTPDPFDISHLRLTQDFVAAAGVKKILNTLPCRKPSKEWFVQTHPDPAYRIQTCVIELREDSETYLVKGWFGEMMIDTGNSDMATSGRMAYVVGLSSRTGSKPGRRRLPQSTELPCSDHSNRHACVAGSDDARCAGEPIEGCQGNDGLEATHVGRAAHLRFEFPMILLLVPGADGTAPPSKLQNSHPASWSLRYAPELQRPFSAGRARRPLSCASRCPLVDNTGIDRRHPSGLATALPRNPDAGRCRVHAVERRGVVRRAS